MQNLTVKGLVSIGIPAYNRPESLKKSIQNVISQTYKNLEIIISNDASPDPKIKAIIEEFASVDSRIKFFDNKVNKGVLANAEFVLRQATGEYFAWVSDDDWRAPEFIESLVRQLELEKNQDALVAFCNYHEVYENGERALGYPLTHMKIFKSFTSGGYLKRTMSFYWTNSTLGKANIFYGVYRKNFLDNLDIQKICGNFKYLNMDCLIVYSLLQQSRAIIIPEVMCTLTCGNDKFYDDEKVCNRSSILNRVFTQVDELYTDMTRYFKISKRIDEKILIPLVFIPKAIWSFILIFLNKFMPERKGIVTPSHVVAEVAEVGKPKLNLPQVTLVAMATKNVEETVLALKYSCKGVNFGKVKLIAHYTPYNLGENVELHKIEAIKSIDEWSYKIIYELSTYIDTEFALLVHADGFVVNPTSWRDEFLKYDYIGAPWPLPTDNFSYRDVNGNIVRAGNSVSLRSKKLLDLPIKLDLTWEPFHGYYNEDGFICVKNRHIYEANGMKIGSIDIAKYFSHENMIPEIKGIKPFVFHKWFGTNSHYPRF